VQVGSSFLSLPPPLLPSPLSCVKCPIATLFYPCILGRLELGHLSVSVRPVMLTMTMMKMIRREMWKKKDHGEDDDDDIVDAGDFLVLRIDLLTF
jgi:hypothetical protein